MCEHLQYGLHLGLSPRRVANQWTEFSTQSRYAMMVSGTNRKTLANSWWLQLSKRQKLNSLLNL